MYKKNPHPASAVSASTGLIGVLSLFILINALSFFKPNADAVSASLILLFGTAMPMVLWEIFIHRAYLRPTSGLCFSIERSSSETLRLTYTKMLGLIVTTLFGYAFYCCAWWYDGGSYQNYFDLLEICWPIILFLAPFYIYFTSRYMVEPRDGLWHVGNLVLARKENVSFQKIYEHILSWIIKLFFLAFMVSILPGSVAGVIHSDMFIATTSGKAQLLNMVSFLINAFFLFDVCFGTIGYILTLRVLDSHVVSPNGKLRAWLAAGLCYPPILLMGSGRLFDYRIGTEKWHYWFADHDFILWVWAAAILLLVASYVWATVIFGIRFSNLTNRGIITVGPYRYFKHPAYISKNLYWWLVYLPFLSNLGAGQAVRNCLALLVVNAIYFARAKTEEMHLMNDPAYAEYSRWIQKNGILHRLKIRRAKI